MPELQQLLTPSIKRVDAVLAALWCNELGCDEVSAHSHFIELGGDSLAAMRICAQLQSQLGIDLELSALLGDGNFHDVVASIQTAVQRCLTGSELAVCRRPLNPSADRSRVRLDALASAFATDGFVRLGQLFADPVNYLLTEEALRLYRNARHKEFIMPTSRTPRRMSTVGGSTIRTYSRLLMQLYVSTPLLELITTIIGAHPYACSHPEEFIVINYLAGEEQTHGWHLDDPDIALVIVLAAPPQHQGGLVEVAYPPFSEKAHERCGDLNAFVNDAVAEGRVRRECLGNGEAYLLKASRYVHGVSPLLGDYARVAVNMAFALSPHQTFGESANLLYGA